MGRNYLSITKLQRLQRWSQRMDTYFHPALYDGCNYFAMLKLNLTHVSKRGSWWFIDSSCHSLTIAGSIRTFRTWIYRPECSVYAYCCAKAEYIYIYIYIQVCCFDCFSQQNGAECYEPSCFIWLTHCNIVFDDLEIQVNRLYGVGLQSNYFRYSSFWIYCF